MGGGFLTLSIKDVSSRVIKPAMVRLANYVDGKLMNLYKNVPHWVGTPGNTINSFNDFAEGTRRLDDVAVPMDDRACVLSPVDYWGLLGNQTTLFINAAAREAYCEGSLGMIGGVDTYMAQNSPSHTFGADVGGTVGAA